MKQNLAVFAASVASGLIGGAAVSAVNFVELQASSPGTAQSGNLNIAGRALASGFGVGVNPSTARIQVGENGALQGVRADTTTGVAVFGSTSATTGTAPAGYFTNKSAGAALVADAQGLAGSTIGGLFYNRAVNGIGVSGRQLNTSGIGAAVQGTAASSGATGVRAVNTGNDSNVLVAGPARGVYVDGGTYRQNYGNGEARAAVPVAYGFVASNGSRISGTPNFTSFYDASNSKRYVITITGESYIFNEYSAVVTRSGLPGDVYTGSSGGNLTVFTTNAAGSSAQNAFAFVVFRSFPSGIGPAGQFPPPSHGFSDDTEWAAKRPREFERYMAARQQAEGEPIQPE